MTTRRVMRTAKRRGGDAIERAKIKFVERFENEAGGMKRAAKIVIDSDQAGSGTVAGWPKATAHMADKPADFGELTRKELEDERERLKREIAKRGAKGDDSARILARKKRLGRVEQELEIRNQRPGDPIDDEPDAAACTRSRPPTANMADKGRKGGGSDDGDLDELLRRQEEIEALTPEQLDETLKGARDVFNNPATLPKSREKARKTIEELEFERAIRDYVDEEREKLGERPKIWGNDDDEP